MKEGMKIKVLLLTLSSSFLVASALNAASSERKGDDKSQILHETKKQMDEQVSQLIADRVDFKKTIEFQKIMKLEEQTLEAKENLLYPADELYGANWDNKWVNPFTGKEKVNLPDSFVVNCISFVFPIDSMKKVTSKYGPRRRRMHEGIDLKLQVGDTVRAAFDGKVRIRKFERRGYGYYLVIRHPNGLETVYGHLSRFLVNENDIVRAGDAIALGGNTGRSTGPHLHFETRFLGQAINPAEIIDFERCEPIKPQYVFRNIKIKGRKSNIYTSSDQNIVFHRVRSGDNLSVIAKKYGTTVSQLCRLNGITTKTIIRPGQSLRLIPSGSYKK